MHDGKIYAMGGYNGRMRMNSVERYDPDANQWELVTPMLRQRSDASAASLEDKVLDFMKLLSSFLLKSYYLDLYCGWIQWTGGDELGGSLRSFDEPVVFHPTNAVSPFWGLSGRLSEYSLCHWGF